MLVNGIKNKIREEFKAVKDLLDFDKKHMKFIETGI